LNKNTYFGLREKQKETFDICLEKKIGIISDTCGSGKSRIEFELICDAISKNSKFIVLAAHRLDLIDQHLENFIEYLENYHPELKNKYNQFEISSASRKSEKYGSIENSTHISEIKNIIISATQPILITLCYYSLDRFYKSFAGSQYQVDLMICDEGHFGMSCEKGKSEKEKLKVSKYDCIKFCKSFLVFTATPFKETMINENISVIHNYTYAEAVEDKIVLPFKANFLIASNEYEYNEKSKLATIISAYTSLKNKYFLTSAKLLVCGSSLEENQLLFNSILSNYKDEINKGNLAICKISSGKEIDNYIIPSCEWVDNSNINLSENKSYKININDERDNKKQIFHRMKEWLKDIRHNIIIIHCQMLGVGIDIPNINGVVILSNKESSDLFQSIMRPCRIAEFDRNKSPENWLEKNFEIFIHSSEDSQKAIKNFIEQLQKIGGLSLLEALELGNISGANGISQIDTTAAKEIYDKIIKASRIEAECKIIFDIDDYKTGINKFLELSKKYPSQESCKLISEQYAKFITIKNSFQ
jgi:superfamily II DNA or RNA helicase